MNENIYSCLEEAVCRGNAQFPVNFIAWGFPQTATTVMAHWHPYIEFVYVSQGSLLYEVRPNTYPLQEKDIVLLGPNVLHSARAQDGMQCQVCSMTFPLDLFCSDSRNPIFRQYIQPVLEGQVVPEPVFHPDTPGYEDLLSCFRQMWACRSGELYQRELLFSAQLCRLIQLIWNHQQTGSESITVTRFRHYEKKLRPALEYMQTHYSQVITIEELASMCGFSSVHFMNLFKSAIGMTCMEYLVAFRLYSVTDQLLNTDTPVAQIARSCGFSNMSYFSRAFRRRFGTSPTQYRAHGWKAAGSQKLTFPEKI